MLKEIIMAKALMHISFTRSEKLSYLVNSGKKFGAVSCSKIQESDRVWQYLAHFSERYCLDYCVIVDFNFGI